MTWGHYHSYWPNWLPATLPPILEINVSCKLAISREVKTAHKLGLILVAKKIMLHSRLYGILIVCVFLSSEKPHNHVPRKFTCSLTLTFFCRGSRPYSFATHFMRVCLIYNFPSFIMAFSFPNWLLRTQSRVGRSNKPGYSFSVYCSK